MQLDPIDLPESAAAQVADALVIGGGPVGIRAAQTLAQQGQSVTVLSAETLPPYNRVRLTPLLSGDVQFGEIELVDPRMGHPSFDLQQGQRVTRIDRAAGRVMTADGGAWAYRSLVLATGSRAFVPGIPGRDKGGVFTFRTADDASALLARSFAARRVAVIGGGLLGLEAARGMRRRQCDVTVIEHEAHLMPRQLDSEGGGHLLAAIEALGVRVCTGVAVKEIAGDHRVEGLVLANGEALACDTVIICTGVRPNIDLARAAKLAFGRGITVNDQMQTSDPAIYAVGECAEHAGQLYGLVGPGYAQAEAAAQAIAGQPAGFAGFAPATKLKVIGADVFSVGEIEQLEVRANVRSHTWRDAAGYRRIFIERGKLVGAVAVGLWDQASRIQDAAQSGAVVYPWMLFRFRATGDLWSAAELSAADMPDGATLCNCTGVTCGQVRGVMADGGASVQEIGARTGASTVCGSCRPLISEMVDASADPEPLPMWRYVLGASGIAVLGALAPFVSGHVPLPESYAPDDLRVWLWQDNIVKQWSGFVLLGLTLLAFLIGLRKRLRFTDRLGSFDAWRLVHSGIGLGALIGFFAHSGFNLGHGWNLALALTFLGTVLAGAVAGIATGGDHALRARRIGSARKPPRYLPTWVHIVAVWPLPVFIVFHVLASYAF